MKNKISVLYISYDGMTDPLGQSQVISYLTRISEIGFNIHIVSFEKSENYEKLKNEILSLIENKNIIWHPLAYTKSPPIISTIKDLFKGKSLIKKLNSIENFNIVHCRGYIPSILGRYIQKTGAKMIFDMRGWWPDEKVESGAWNSLIFKPIYHLFKNLENKFFKESDFIVSLTHVGKEEISKKFNVLESKIGVIPTCVNFDVFKEFNPSIRNSIRTKLDIPESAKVLYYSGSLGGNYDLTLFVNFFNAFNDVFPDSYFLILSKTDKTEIENYFRANTKYHNNIRISSTNYSNVHKYIMAGDVGLILYGKGFSNIGRSPTKLGEYWACGLPIISLPKIGDVDIILSEGGGCVIEDNSIENMVKSFNQVNYNEDKKYLRKKAEDYYSLEKGVQFYVDVYNKLLI